MMKDWSIWTYLGLQNGQDIRQLPLGRLQALLAAFQVHELTYETAKVEMKEISTMSWKINQIECTLALQNS